MLAGTFVSQPLLRAERLVKHFKAVRAVDDISFELYPGETLALVGESATGGTSLASRSARYARFGARCRSFSRTRTARSTRA